MIKEAANLASDLSRDLKIDIGNVSSDVLHRYIDLKYFEIIMSYASIFVTTIIVLIIIYFFIRRSLIQR